MLTDGPSVFDIVSSSAPIARASQWQWVGAPAHRNLGSWCQGLPEVREGGVDDGRQLAVLRCGYRGGTGDHLAANKTDNRSLCAGLVTLRVSLRNGTVPALASPRDVAQDYVLTVKSAPSVGCTWPAA